MENRTGILLNSHFSNNMKIGGELAWFIKESNPSTGYAWKFTPDNSGVYEEVERVTLHASTDAVGVPGTIIWQFKAVRAGSGSMRFDLFPPGSNDPVESIFVNIQVK